MRKLFALFAAITTIAALALIAWSSTRNYTKRMAENLATYEVAEPAPPQTMQSAATVAMPAPIVASPPAVDSPAGMGDGDQAATPTPLTVAIPQMAYAYSYAFRLPEASVAKVQARHVALCDALGAARCQVLSMQTGKGEDQVAAGSLKLRVATAEARRFGVQLGSAVSDAGGRTVSSRIEAEDVSKQIVDTEARLRQRELLVVRLTEILRTRQGKVAELVEAERSVAAAQEEIDQAKGWLTELRARVAMSTIDVSYEAIAAGPVLDHREDSLGSSVVQSIAIFLAGLVGIVRLAIFVLPWLLLAGALWLGARRFGPRLTGWRKPVTPGPTLD